jgi:hypothetical protein
MPSGELVGTTLKFTGREVTDGHSHFSNSERGPALQGQEFNSIKSDEVRVSLLVYDEWAIIPQTRQQTRSPPACGDRYDDSTVSPTAARACEALALSFVDLTARDSFIDEELAPRAIPKRIFAWKPQTSAYKRPPARSQTFGEHLAAANVASKSRRPISRGRPQI